jgi:hypothetical protein
MLRESESGASSNPQTMRGKLAVPKVEIRWLLDRPVKPDDDRIALETDH